MNWDSLSALWQAACAFAWEAYCDDCIPIGAVVTDVDGTILSRGRNRIYEKHLNKGRLRGDELAHAEMEALHGLDYASIDAHACSLYTTTEPCPMCMGTFYMSGIRTLHYAARDPWAGSTNLLGTTRYLSRKPVEVHGPLDPWLEIVLTALFVERDCGFHAGDLPESAFYACLAEAVAPGIEFGKRLWETGDLRRMRQAGVSAGDVFKRLLFLVQ